MSGAALHPENDPALDPTPTTEAMSEWRTQLGAGIAPHQGLVLLDVGNAHCYLGVNEGSRGHPTPVVHYIQLGLTLLTERTFKKHMPTPAQLESAIMVVEDAIMPMARLIPDPSVLATRDPLLLHIAQVATGRPELAWQPPSAEHPPTAVSREAVEALFDQLVAQASRDYRSSMVGQGLPTQPRFAAALVILREALHHWQFAQLYLLPRRAGTHTGAAAGTPAAP